MTYEEFSRQLGKAGLTVREFAELIKMHPNSITNCRKKGDVPSHLAVTVALMGELAERHVNFRDVLLKIEITSKKPRGAGKGKFGGNKQNDLDLFIQ